jgi:hypothetical protein
MDLIPQIIIRNSPTKAVRLRHKKSWRPLSSPLRPRRKVKRFSYARPSRNINVTEILMQSTETEPANATESITFHCRDLEAEIVCLIGDFNNWNAAADPMERQRDGSWQIKVVLNPGRHYYQFLVDGEPMLDPEAMCVIRRDLGSRVSLIALS